MPEEKDVQMAKAELLLPKTLTDLDLQCSDFPKPKFVVPGLISEGLTTFAGKPKVGKSLLFYRISLDVADGKKVFGVIPVDQCEVLYLAFEETPNRLKYKLSRMRGEASPTNRIHFAFQWPRINEGGLECLKETIKQHPSVRLVVIDTFARFRSLNTGSFYNRDYEEVSTIKKIADENSLGIILIHHLRKASAQDQLDLVTGSTGLTGSADSVAILTRDRMSTEATLFVSGRDIEERNLALKFDPATFSLTMIGEAEEYRLSKERQEILKILEAANDPMKLKDICSALGKKEPGVHKHLMLLVECGRVEQAAYGKYQIRKNSKSSENGESAESVVVYQ